MAINGNGTAVVDETTPLIPPKPVKYGKAVLYKLLFTGLLVSLSFGVTQVPLVYVFRLMTCDAYYKTHEPPPPGFGDRCSVREIEASTAAAVAILGFSTTFFGLFNLFVTRWGMERFGIKETLISQIFCPALRLAVQNVGVMTGGSAGILIVQCSQIITIAGGPAGYLLALNNFVAEVIEPSERTGALGRLQGAAMVGTSIGFLSGGLISDIFNIEVPFRVSWILFLSACVYVALVLPKAPKAQGTKSKGPMGLAKFFGPMRSFVPQKWTLENGRSSTQYGALLLGIGVFLGILATGYIPVLLQLYSTDVLGFGTTENGVLISINTGVRGLFLTFAFPLIIKYGRKWMDGRKEAGRSPSKDSGIPEIPTEPSQLLGTVEVTEEDEPVEPPANPDDKQEIFDLQFTKYSLLLDGLLTGAGMFVKKGWQMYVVALLLPFASGTGSAAKGTILQMCPASERADALSAITLVEMIARLSTTSLFGLVFALFAQIGQPQYVFTCNAAVAVLGFTVLLFCNFPPPGSKRVIEEDDTHEQVETS